jgi:D-alanine-D-alanine ligase
MNGLVTLEICVENIRKEEGRHTKTMRVGLMYNLKTSNADPADERGAEWDEPETINAILQALSSEHEVVPIPADLNAYQKLSQHRLDIVFNIAEGHRGPNREAHIPAILEFLNIPYTGSDPFTLSACLDKCRTKEILSYHRIPTPRFHVIRKLSELNGSNLFPAIVKPLWEGSSIGIRNSSWVENKIELHQEVERIIEGYDQPALVEEAVKGREFTVALLGNENELTVLPIVEIRLDVLPPQAHPIYSYEAKWVWDVQERPLDIFQCPASIDFALKRKLEDVSMAAFRALGCKDWCRIDLRLNGEGAPYVLELNPLPGILPDPRQNSCFPKAARAAGMDYSQMVLRILDVAVQRYEMSNLIQEQDKKLKISDKNLYIRAK